jgi:hypothetical protein
MRNNRYGEPSGQKTKYDSCLLLQSDPKHADSYLLVGGMPTAKTRTQNTILICFCDRIRKMQIPIPPYYIGNQMRTPYALHQTQNREREVDKQESHLLVCIMQTILVVARGCVGCVGPMVSDYRLRVGGMPTANHGWFLNVSPTRDGRPTVMHVVLMPRDSDMLHNPTSTQWRPLSKTQGV